MRCNYTDDESQKVSSLSKSCLRFYLRFTETTEEISTETELLTTTEATTEGESVFKNLMS